MYKAKITSAEKVRHQAKNIDFLDVAFDILDEKGEVQVSKRIGMDVASTSKEVQEMVNGHIKEHGREVENAKVDVKKQEANKNIKDIQESLVGKTIGEGKESEEKEVDKEE